MGRRSRKPGRAAAPAPLPPEGLFARARESWRGAGERPVSRPVYGRQAEAPRGRPLAVWHPWPVSELAILGGIVVLVVGLSRGAGGFSTAVFGVLLCAVGSFEVAVREHLTGFRSHALVLALVPTIVLHLVIAATVGAPVARGPLLLLVDIVVFLALLWQLGRLFRLAHRRAMADNH